MLKIIFVTLCVLIAVVVSYFYILGRISQKQSISSSASAPLKPCPKTPNCVCSEYPEDQSHFTSSITLNGSIADDPITLSRHIIEDMGGEITEQTNDYLAAVFKSSLFGFVDDFQLRIDTDQHLHMRAASRVGKSDFGVNQKRIDTFKSKFMMK